MSKQFLERFFPAISTIVKSNHHLEACYDFFFPDDVALLCPERTVSLKLIFLPESSTIRNPILLLAAILGIVIGMFGYWYFGYYSSKTKSDERKEEEEIIWMELCNTTISKSFYYFGMMNVTAVWLHCILPPPSASYVGKTTDEGDDYYYYYRIFLWTMDCYFTGLSSTFLYFSCAILILVRSNDYYNQRQQQKNNKIHSTIFSIVSYICNNVEYYSFQQRRWIIPILGSYGLGFLCIGSFVFLRWIDDDDDETTTMSTLPLESWYLVPTILNSYFLSPLLYLTTTTQATTSNNNNIVIIILLSMIGFGCIILGLSMDASFCRLLNNNNTALWDTLTASTMTFIGCDISFLAVALLFSLSSSRKEDHNVSKKEQKKIL